MYPYAWLVKHQLLSHLCPNFVDDIPIAHLFNAILSSLYPKFVSKIGVIHHYDGSYHHRHVFLFFPILHHFFWWKPHVGPFLSLCCNTYLLINWIHHILQIMLLPISVLIFMVVYMPCGNPPWLGSPSSSMIFHVDGKPLRLARDMFQQD